MILIQQIKTQVILGKSDSKETLKNKAAKLLGISLSEISDIQILKHSIDARKSRSFFMFIRWESY